MQNKIISFSLWGNKDIYTEGALWNARIAPEIYPGWKTHFYVDDSIPLDTLAGLQVLADNVFHVVDRPKKERAFWRFLPMIQHETVAIFRDCDSRINEREFAAVEEWINSDKQFHSMKDHPAHIWPFMAGMWGAKSEGPVDTIKLYDDLVSMSSEEYFADQIALRSKQDLLIPHTLVHNQLNFPTHRKMSFGRFVGQRINPDNTEGPE